MFIKDLTAVLYRYNEPLPQCNCEASQPEQQTLQTSSWATIEI